MSFLCEVKKGRLIDATRAFYTFTAPGGTLYTVIYSFIISNVKLKECPFNKLMREVAVRNFIKAPKHPSDPRRPKAIISPMNGNDKLGLTINTLGLANSAKTELLEYTVRIGSNQSGMRAELQVLGKFGTRYLAAAKSFSKFAGFAGGGVTIADAYIKGEWHNHHTADLLIGVGSIYLLTGPVGWAVGGGYFLLDVGVKPIQGNQ